MYIVFLRFSDNQVQASKYMAGHKQWLQTGFDSGIFLLAGSIHPHSGGLVLAHNIAEEDLIDVVNNDPFVTENVVKAEIVRIDPTKSDSRLAFILDSEN